MPSPSPEEQRAELEQVLLETVQFTHENGNKIRLNVDTAVQSLTAWHEQAVADDRAALLSRIEESFDTHTVPESPRLLDRQYVRNTIEFERKRETIIEQEEK